MHFKSKKSSQKFQNKQLNIFRAFLCDIYFDCSIKNFFKFKGGRVNALDSGSVLNSRNRPQSGPSLCSEA